MLGVVTTFGIVIVLAVQTIEFFQQVNPIDFFTGTNWSASIQPYPFGVLPLVSGHAARRRHRDAHRRSRSGCSSAILLVGVRLDRASANVIKPILETIAGIPTIVLGFFAINFLAPEVLKPIFGSATSGSSRRSPGGIVVGILITPLIASISEDAMRAVPARPARGRLRDGRDQVRGRPQGRPAGRASRGSWRRSSWR